LAVSPFPGSPIIDWKSWRKDLGVKKIKGAKKSVFKTGEILSLGQRTKAWVEDNQLYFAAVVVAVVLISAMIWGFRAYGAAKERQAQADYARLFGEWPAEDHVDSKQWDKLIPEIAAFIKGHQGTVAALNAELDLCQAYLQAKRYEDVVKQCDQVLQDGSATQDLKSLVRYQIALSYQAMGKTDEAIKQWNVLKTEGHAWLAREADWRLARLYVQKNEYSKAVEQYEEALKSSGDYPPTVVLEEELASAKAKVGSAGNQQKADPQG
jgi:predicted negative regulator of RcsB-dependent stress response